MSFSKLSDRPRGAWEIRRTEILQPPPERVWEALTRPDELCQWWCDEARVGVRPGEPYTFFGPTVFRVRSSKEGDEERRHDAILALEPNETLSFRWRLGGVETTVSYELTTHLAQTVLTVRQFGSAPPCWNDSPLLPTWWWLGLANLRHYLEEGSPALRLRFDGLEERSGPLRLSLGVTTFPWVIWGKLTGDTELARWLAARPAVDLSGGRYRLDELFYVAQGAADIGPRTLVGWSEEKRLRHDWHWGTTAVSEVEWTIQPTDDDTVVSVSDSGPWPPWLDRHQLGVFWASVLLALLDMSEKGRMPQAEGGETS